MTRAPSRLAPRQVWRDGRAETGVRAVPEETAIAFVFDHSAEAVMMATPSDLEDFAYGFALNEAIVAAPADIVQLEIIDLPLGIEVRMRLAAPRSDDLKRRRRHRAGPVGCGLCGVEGLEDALRAPPPVNAVLRVSPAEIIAGMSALAARQPLHEATRAVHAAGFLKPGAGLVCVREDVGRHNALDKLAGALARADVDARAGVVVMTSRVSVELVQKAARMGAPILAAISAPTSLALRMADESGMTIVGIVRNDGLEVFTHAARIDDAERNHVAKADDER